MQQDWDHFWAEKEGETGPLQQQDGEEDIDCEIRTDGWELYRQSSQGGGSAQRLNSDCEVAALVVAYGGTVASQPGRQTIVVSDGVVKESETGKLVVLTSQGL